MGIYLSEPKKEKTTDIGGNAKFDFAASCMQGWRTNMEDAHIAKVDIGPDTHVFGVFDGHGGREVALFVEKYFIRELMACQEFQANDMGGALSATFLKMDVMLLDPKNRQELLSYKNKDKSTGDSDGSEEIVAGCTANVIIIKDNVIFCANAGDSRCCVGNNGSLVKLSKDHKPDDEGEHKRITEAGGYVADGRVNSNLNLSRALGDLEYKKDKKRGVDKQLIIAVPDIKSRKLVEKDEFIIIGCDGIWETQTSPEIITWVRTNLKTNPVKKVVENMLDWLIAPDTANGAGCDNMSAIIIKINS